MLWSNLTFLPYKALFGPEWLEGGQWTQEQLEWAETVVAQTLVEERVPGLEPAGSSGSREGAQQCGCGDLGFRWRREWVVSCGERPAQATTLSHCLPVLMPSAVETRANCPVCSWDAYPNRAAFEGTQLCSWLGTMVIRKWTTTECSP